MFGFERQAQPRHGRGCVALWKTGRAKGGVVSGDTESWHLKVMRIFSWSVFLNSDYLCFCGFFLHFFLL